MGLIDLQGLITYIFLCAQVLDLLKLLNINMYTCLIVLPLVHHRMDLVYALEVHDIAKRLRHLGLLTKTLG